MSSGSENQTCLTMEWVPAVVRRQKLATCARDYLIRDEVFPTTNGAAPFQLHRATGQLRTFNSQTGMWTVSLDDTADDILSQLHEKFIVVRPISRISTDHRRLAMRFTRTCGWRRSHIRTTMVPPKYTPAYLDLTYDEKAPFIQRILPSFLQWERSLHQEKLDGTAAIFHRQERHRGFGVRVSVNPDPQPADVDDAHYPDGIPSNCLVWSGSQSSNSDQPCGSDVATTGVKPAANHRRQW